MEPTQTEKAKCSKCGCNDLTIIKKGYNVTDGAYGFIAIAVVLAVLWGMSVASPDFNQIPKSYISLAVVVSLLLASLGLLVGIKGMNDLYTVCINCGFKNKINPK